MKSKVILLIVLALVFQGGMSVFAQENTRYSVTLKTRYAVFTSEDGTSFTVERNFFTGFPKSFTGFANGINISSEDGNIVLSDSSKVLGTASKRKFREFVMHDGSVYSIVPQRSLFRRHNVVEYSVDGIVSERASYSFDHVLSGKNISLELTSNNSDFKPLLLLAALADIISTHDGAWFTTLSTVMTSTM